MCMKADGTYDTEKTRTVKPEGGKPFALQCTCEKVSGR